MKAAHDEEETRTIETRLSHPQLYPVLEQLLSFFASLRHRLWRDLVIKSMNINELKRDYIKDFGLTARQFNSLAKELSAKELALEEIRKERLSKLATAIKSNKEAIGKAEKAIIGSEKDLKAIGTYRQKIKTWQQSSAKKQPKKPKMPASIRGKFTDQIKQEIRRKQHYIHQKKRRLNILTHKFDKLNANKSLSLCFGSKAAFKNQYHLDAEKFENHEEWLEDFRLKRSSQVFFLGSSDETAGNQTVQYDPNQQTLKLRLPNALPFVSHGTHISFDAFVFPEHLRAVFLSNLSKPGPDARKNQKTNGPLSYRLVRRINPHTLEKAYYIQVSFSVPAPEKQTELSRGAVGIDLNADHLAVTETDRFGNYLDSFILPFNLKELATEQTKAIIGDLSAVIVDHALATGKALAIEELDFEEKKKALREQVKERRTFLSAFAYAQFQKAIHSKARAQGLELIAVNPAYTSLIGAYKYQGLDISSHEKAALAIARRAQAYGEGLQVFQGTLPTQVMMSEKTEFEKGSRHVWGFYGDNRQKIRRLLIEPDIRPLLPIKRALSLAKGHPSLYQSLTVTWQERLGESLHRDSA